MIISEELLKFIIILLSWWGIIFGGIYLILVILKGIYSDKFNFSTKFLHVSFIISVLIYGLLALFTQYQVWASSEFTKLLTSLPISNEVPLPGLLIIFKPLFLLPHGYLLHYSFVHFWLSIFWSFISTGILVSLLSVIKKKRPYLISNIELSLITAGSLVLGWPYMTVFVSLMFVLFVLHSVYNNLRGRTRTVIFPSALSSIFIVFIFSNFFSSLIPFISHLNFVVK